MQSLFVTVSTVVHIQNDNAGTISTNSDNHGANSPLFIGNVKCAIGKQDGETYQEDEAGETEVKRDDDKQTCLLLC